MEYMEYMISNWEETLRFFLGKKLMIFLWHQKLDWFGMVWGDFGWCLIVFNDFNDTLSDQTFFFGRNMGGPWMTWMGFMWNIWNIWNMWNIWNICSLIGRKHSDSFLGKKWWYFYGTRNQISEKKYMDLTFLWGLGDTPTIQLSYWIIEHIERHDIFISHSTKDEECDLMATMPTRILDFTFQNGMMPPVEPENAIMLRICLCYVSPRGGPLGKITYIRAILFWVSMGFKLPTSIYRSRCCPL